MKVADRAVEPGSRIIKGLRWQPGLTAPRKSKGFLDRWQTLRGEVEMGPRSSGVFSQWQPRYAQHGVATFPVEITPDSKKPAISHYDRVRLPGSAKLAAEARFAQSEAIGFLCGPRNGITVIDMDDTDPKILEEGQRLFGHSPLVWQTGGGK